MIKRILINHINKNKILYIIVSIIFLIGICLGVFCINSLNNESLESSKKYFDFFKENVVKMENTDINSLFINSFKTEFKFLGIIFLLSCTIIGGEIVYLCILYKGFSLGYVISAILRTYGVRKGIVFSIITLGFHNLIYIPCLIFFTIYSINFCKNIKNRRVNIKGCFLKLLITFIFILVISTISQTIELTISYKILKKMQNFF